MTTRRKSENFDFANIYEWQLQYGMNNYKQGRAEKGSELFISNYELPIEQIVQKKIEQLRLI